MSNNGWIKIYRSLQDHWIWENEKYLKWWLDLLLLANHQDRDILINGELTTIKRGQRHTSELWLSERWNADRKTVRKFLSLLQKNEMIVLNKSRQKGTTYEITNYNDFQGISEDEGTTKRTTTGTSNWTSEGQRTGHKQELKNDKELKKERNTTSDAIEFFKDNFNRPLPSSFETETILHMINDSNEELVIAAMKIAVSKNTKHLNFVQGVLRNWENANIKTIEEARAYEQDFIDRKNNKPTYQRGGRKAYEPDWLDKQPEEITTKPADPDLNQQVEEIKRKLREERDHDLNNSTNQRSVRN